MDADKASDSAQFTPVNPFLLGIGWVKPLAEAPMRAYAAVGKEMLGATARQLEACTDYVKKLAECDDPAKSVACWGEFMRQSVASSFAEGQHVMEALQKSLAAPSSK